MAPRITRDPVSPTGTPLWRCTQAERHEWIRQLAPDVDPADTEALRAHPAWPTGFEVTPLDSFIPGAPTLTRYRVEFRERPDAAGTWLIVHSAPGYDAAVEEAFIVACETRKARHGTRVDPRQTANVTIALRGVRREQSNDQSRDA